MPKKLIFKFKEAKLAMVENGSISDDGWLAVSHRPLHDTTLLLDDPIVGAAWNALEGVNGAVDGDMRVDFCGALVRRQDYGNTESDFGWTVRLASRFELKHLNFTRYWRACHVRNGKEGTFFVCSVTRSGQKNIEWEIYSPMVFFPKS